MKLTQEQINEINVIDPETVTPDCKCVTCKCEKDENNSIINN